MSCANSIMMKTVRTASKDWQQECLQLARAGEDFVVEGTAEDLQPFMKRLCRTCNYRQLIIEKGLLLLPGF